MLLNSFDSRSTTKISKINNFLKEQFGFVMSSNIDTNKLQSVYKELSADIYKIKIEENASHRSPELAKKLLMLEGVKLIMEQQLTEFRIVADKNYNMNGKYKTLIDCLTGYVHKHIELGDSKEEAIADAMKNYRSSKYRWPDFEVESDITMRIDGMLGLEEADFYYSTNDEMEKAATDFLNHPDSSGELAGAELEPMDDYDTNDTNKADFQRNMAKAKLNRQQQGTKMRENYVKKLRQLLESEVEQAEVLIAARGFAQELQDMIEKVGRLQNEDLGPVTDQMRNTYGAKPALSFQGQMHSELQQVLDELRGAKARIDAAVSGLASGVLPGEMNDMDVGLDDMEPEMDGMDMEPDLDLGLDDDEFAGDDTMAGPEDEPLGRATRESKEVLKHKIVEMKQRIAKAKAKSTAK